MSHAMFVGLSYGSAGLVIFGLIMWLVLDARATRAELARLEAQGIKRRSDA
ncbi:MAG: heme exporter protein CcmD [Pseudomonadota bacterium]